MKLYNSIIFLCLLFSNCGNSAAKAEQNGKIDKTTESRLKEKADSALVFCKKKGLNTDFCILIDMSVHSGKYRFFIWNFKDGNISHKALCAHGYGKESTQEKPVFSNIEGSYCSSLGRYKTGVRSYSQYGINVHYKLHGYDNTNSNAFKRWIVLHSYSPVPATETYPKHLPLGWSQGCPVTDNATMTILDKDISASKKPVLLWIYQ